MILRSIADRRRVIHESQFSFCPICGGELSEYEQGDIYVQGFKCRTGHNWGLRGGYFRTATAGTKFGLHGELSDTVLRNLTSSWLKGHPLMDRQLHVSVRRVLVEHARDREQAG